ncbi:MAG: sigma-70 family RNA polymerase sigma factor [Proteobacteria bacterium]|nr:sigma-70 family RNA polymerase sigma factor [Pseudomonadota bacterium]
MPSGRESFGELVRAYRGPILAFFHARMPADAAQDATQSFLAASYELGWWSRADAQRGSFRNFLRVLLRRHLGKLRAAHTPDGDSAIDTDAIADTAPDADHQFDLRFALALTARAVDAQRAQYGARGRGDLFESLLPLLSSPPEHGELKEMAAALGLPANTLTVEINRLRKRLREQMRSLVADLCADEASFAGEWDAVQAILQGR